MYKGIQLPVFILLLSLIMTGCGVPAQVSPVASHYNLTGSSETGPFSVKRIQLGFSANMANNLTVTRGQLVQPKAIMRISGQGNFRANWVLDDRVIEQVNLSVHRGSVLTLSLAQAIQTEALASGRHQIMLKISNPPIQLLLPEITFFVR